MTSAIGVLVGTAAPQPHAVVVQPAAARERPHLKSDSDVRQTALHRAHLTAAQRIDCAACHDLRANDFRAPPPATCLNCHANHAPEMHAKSATAAACLACHDFLHAADAAKQCEQCHADPQGSHPAIAIHKDQDCTTCHAPHTPRTSLACAGCHAKQATQHPAGTGAAQCMTCHVPHTPGRAAAERCATCHVAGASELPAAVRIPATALFAGGHERCVQCHAGHTFTRQTAAPCRECHQSKHVSTAHAACTTCHDPHDARTRPTPARCTTCHTGKHVIGESRVAAHTCTNCHDPHDAAPAPRCATCHAEIAASSQHPAGACTGCHPPHTAGANRIVVGCTERCHAERREHGTATCRDCHIKHRFVPALTREFCLGCHAAPKGHAPAIATSNGHAQCTNCHASAPHAASTPRPACATCHAAEASTAPPGHTDCKKCHDVHSGERRFACASCHEDRTHTPHVRVAGGCEACHRPHGPNGVATRPACTQCHSGMPGPHIVAKHANCTDCHRAHKTAIEDREVCLRCHTDKRTHIPDATRCQACHTFGGEK